LRKRLFAVVIMTGSLLSACAPLDSRTEPPDDSELVTGSNLVRRYRSDQSVSQMSTDDMQDLQRRAGRPSTKAGKD